MFLSMFCTICFADSAKEFELLDLGMKEFAVIFWIPKSFKKFWNATERNSGILFEVATAMSAKLIIKINACVEFL